MAHTLLDGFPYRYLSESEHMKVSESQSYGTSVRIKLRSCKEQATNTNDNVDASQMHFEKWKKQDSKGIYCVIPFIEPFLKRQI